MKTNRALSSFVVVCAIAGVTSAFGAGCGGGQNPKNATVKVGEMPTGESWTGVYFHPVFGYLHMVEEEANVIGKWKRANQSAWGELSGTKTGNVVHFTWKEHKVGMVGPSAETSGKGVFVYKMGDNNIAELDGQFGLADSEVGSEWHNVKQQRMTPDLKSIGGDPGAGTAPQGAGWE